MVSASDILAEPGVRQVVDAHAMAWFPKECCGLLVDGPEGYSAVLTPNGLDEGTATGPVREGRTAETGYRLDPIHLLRSAKRGETLVGIFHSHCGVGAYFSDEDRRRALSPTDEPWFPGVEYVVLDVQASGVKGFKVFEWANEEREFIER